MPTHRGKDKAGYFYQWGTQSKYYFIKDNRRSETIARNKANKQGVAISISEHKSNK